MRPFRDEPPDGLARGGHGYPEVPAYAAQGKRLSGRQISPCMIWLRSKLRYTRSWAAEAALCVSASRA